MNVFRAGPEQLPELARLFDLYRQFYDCPPNLSLAETFLAQRLGQDESVIFAARLGNNTDNSIAGFVQLYPSFCSVDAIKILILYDLYVDAQCRRLGVGEMLMKRASSYALEVGAGRLDLLTAHSNSRGQRLYEKLGYEKTNQDFYAYSLYVTP
ncbi:MAG: GNAT family N-acetyltransferase [Pseudomonadota bacterium]